MPRPRALVLPDLTGRTALVTGASDGIGTIIAERLARAGASLILPVRSAQKGATVAERIRAAVSGAEIALPALDLASQASVSELVAQLTAQARPIHLLINNAGVMTPPERVATRDGHELQFGTNHLGHFALTLGILPLLRAGGARVVHQTSIAARSGSIQWADLDSERDYDPMRAYRQSKIAVALFGLELERRSRAAGWDIRSAVSHPGVSPTNLLAAQPGSGRPDDTRELRVIRALSRVGIAGTPETAALPALMAATTVQDAGGRFYGPTRILTGPPAVRPLWSPLRDASAARRLWAESERMTGVTVPA